MGYGSQIIEPDEERDDDIYVLVIHGFVPEFYDGVAFRIDKSFKPRRTKDISCPHCGRKFETVGVDIKVEVFRFSKKSEETCHNFRHCKICHNIIGLKFA
ncbi:MAG: hypothetical protein LBR83_02760 [Clostridiales bacterium]|jgi:hypothetical protein|nr:hypothetical protein [Clostridiales bacterium]